MNKIKYTETDQIGLDLIEDLWLKLRAHHQLRSLYFKKHYETYTFHTRKQQLLAKLHNGALHIDLATDTKTGKLVGYCVSTISEGQGEIDSIYIEEDHRRSGIGDNLMKKAMGWMDKMSVTNRIISVATGNEEVFEFYARYNFYPRRTILMQIQ